MNDRETLQLFANMMSNTTRSRMAQAMSGGNDNADTLHNVYKDYGYPEELSFTNFWNMYRRFGIAGRVVNLPVTATWSESPVIESDSALFLSEFSDLVDKKLWQRLKAADNRQRVGRYAGLFMRVKDGLPPDKPIAGTLSGPESLMDMLPLYESQLEVMESDTDPMSERYGLPIMYQFNGTAEGARSDDTPSSFNIHYTRVIPFAEGADNGSIYGIPALENVYNSLMDLRKIFGAGGEGFYKNAAQNILFDVRDPKSAATLGDKISKFSDQFDDFQKNRMQRGLVTPNLEATQIDSNLANPKEFADNSLQDVSAGSGIPSSLLVGNQTGVLAGDQDGKGFAKSMQERRENWGSEMIVEFIDWCIEWGVLESAEYEIVWPDAMAPSQHEKLDNADKMSGVNQKQYQSGGEMPFDASEIREAAGFAPEEVPEIDSLDEPDDGDE